MAQLVKKWEDGSSLSVTYPGNGDGAAVFSSDANEGIDREMAVVFRGAGKEETRTVRQIGLRETLITADNLVLCDVNGEVLGALKG